jgi:hypothetical protein
MPSLRVTRPKGELISQKGGCCSISFLSQSHCQPLLFDPVASLKNVTEGGVLGGNIEL